jgi:hypothetical protein
VLILKNIYCAIAKVAGTKELSPANFLMARHPDTLSIAKRNEQSGSSIHGQTALTNTIHSFYSL